MSTVYPDYILPFASKHLIHLSFSLPIQFTVLHPSIQYIFPFLCHYILPFASKHPIHLSFSLPIHFTICIQASNTSFLFFAITFYHLHPSNSNTSFLSFAITFYHLHPSIQYIFPFLCQYILPFASKHPIHLSFSLPLHSTICIQASNTSFFSLPLHSTICIQASNTSFLFFANTFYHLHPDYHLPFA